MVKANDKVLAGEPLIRLIDNEAQARLATVDAQIALPPAAAQRREIRRLAPPRGAGRKMPSPMPTRACWEAQTALDRAAIERRAGRGSDADVDAARTALTRAQDRQKQQKAELRRIETDTNTPCRARNEGSSISRAPSLRPPRLRSTR